MRTGITPKQICIACAVLLDAVAPEERVQVLKLLLEDAQREAKKPQPPDPRQLDWTERVRIEKDDGEDIRTCGSTGRTGNEV